MQRITILITKHELLDFSDTIHDFSELPFPDVFEGRRISLLLIVVLGTSSLLLILHDPPRRIISVVVEEKEKNSGT